MAAYIISDIHTFAVSPSIVAGDAAVGHGETAAIHVDTATGVCRVAGNGAAGHVEAAILIHIHAAAIFDCRVVGNDAAIHGEGAPIYIHAATFAGRTVCCLVVANLAAIHVEGAITIHIHAAA